MNIFDNYECILTVGQPVPLRGTQKYGPEGLFSEATFSGYGFPSEVVRALTVAGNNSLAKSTWSVYRTAMGHLGRCQEELGLDMTLPLERKQVVAFVGWLLAIRGVRGSTVESYLSGLRAVHVAKGYDVPCLRPDVIKSIITGSKNMAAIQDRAGLRPRRLPMTMDLMLLLKLELNDLDESIHFKRLTWAIACLLFFGAFRVHELLSRRPDVFDPDFTLLSKDLCLHSAKEGGVTYRMVQVLLKSPKENRVGNKVIVDVYENQGVCCPVRALEKWQHLAREVSPHGPAFMLESGKAYTGALFNKVLKDCLRKYVKEEAGFLTSHSFRTGLASMMGELGFSSEDVMAMGRWSSSAFETYMRLPRTKRAAMARRFAGLPG